MILKGKVTHKEPGLDGGWVTIELESDGVFGREFATVRLGVPRESYQELGEGDQMAMRLVRTETADGTKTMLDPHESLKKELG